jgi:hypothetical protein
MFQEFENSDCYPLSDIVTGNMTWIYQYDPEIKYQTIILTFAHNTPPV